MSERAGSAHRALSSCYNMPMDSLMDVLRELPPLMPQFLRRRRVGLEAPQQIAAELGIGRPLLFTMLQLDHIAGIYDQDSVSHAQWRAYDPYAVRYGIAEPLEALEAKGLVLEDEAGLLTLSPEARQAVEAAQQAGVEYVSKRNVLPIEDLTRLADALQRASDAVEANPVMINTPGSHLKGYVAVGRFSQGVDAPMASIEQAILELWGARDDAHTTAWRAAEIEGPAFDVLSHIWSGTNSLTQLVEVLQYKQTPDDLDSSLAWLAERELVERHGDELHITPAGALLREDIESETDRIYFEGWPFNVEEAEWVRDTLRAVVAGLDSQQKPASG